MFKTLPGNLKSFIFSVSFFFFLSRAPRSKEKHGLLIAHCIHLLFLVCSYSWVLRTTRWCRTTKTSTLQLRNSPEKSYVQLQVIIELSSLLLVPSKVTSMVQRGAKLSAHGPWGLCGFRQLPACGPSYSSFA